MSYDLIIIGAGPAGLTAAIYARRALLKTLILEKSLPGGKLNKTAEVENYPGFTKVGGPELAQKFVEHARNYNIDLKEEEVILINKDNQKIFEVKTKNMLYSSKAVIIASGTKENQLKVPGETEFTNFGVSYCAICDGFLFKGKEVAVVGGGYSALETALYMSNVASKVYLIHRRDSFRAEKEIIAWVQRNPKITFFLNSLLTEIKGKEAVEKVVINNQENGQATELLVQAVFPCIGLLPFSKFAHELGICDRQNYITIKDDCSTMVPGLFAAGDVARTNENKIKQIVTAVAEGAIAAQSVIKYLDKNMD